jgi:hypothetical protein
MSMTQALLNIRPGCQWEINGDTYEGIVWREGNALEKPTKEELDAEILRLTNEYTNNEYQRLRAKEYPAFADQFDLLYHGGYDAWKTAIDVIKNKYPKP